MIATLGDLRTAVLHLRTDQDVRFGEFLQLAEQRIYLGGLPDERGDMLAQPVRIREMETTADVTITGGTGPLPAGYLDKRLAYWVGAQTVDLGYEPPEVFWPSSPVRAGMPLPVAYTIEGSSIRVSPAVSGTLKLLHYARAAPLADSGDTNVILSAHPDIYFHGCQIELYRSIRNDGRRLQSERDYIAAVTAANRHAVTSRMGGGALRRRSGWRGP